MDTRRIEALLSAPPITSRQNARVSDCAKLTDRKHRRATGRFRFDGIKLAIEAMRSGVTITSVFLRASDAPALLERLLSEGGELSSNVELLRLEDTLFARLSEEQAPEGVICVAEMLPIHALPLTTDAIAPHHRVTVIESVRDPSNLGAILRSAAAFGVDVLVLSEDCADLYNAKTVRASMGTVFRQRVVRVPDVPMALCRMREWGRRSFAAALHQAALPLGSFVPCAQDCVVIGNEGHGLRPQTVQAADACVLIPMCGGAESLNAAVAAAILMWEFHGKQERVPVGDPPISQAKECDDRV